MVTLNIAASRGGVDKVASDAKTATDIDEGGNYYRFPARLYDCYTSRSGCTSKVDDPLRCWLWTRRVRKAGTEGAVKIKQASVVEAQGDTV